jgi:hypothetical protein
MADIFISHRGDDEAQFDKIVEGLVKLGVVEAGDKVVDSTKISSPGTDIRKKLLAAMDAASKVVVIWTDESAASQFANYEVGLADALGKPVVVAAPTGAKHSVPAQLRNAQFVPLKKLMPGA